MPTLARTLVEKTAACVKAGAFPVFTLQDLAHLVSKTPDKEFSQRISRIARSGELKRVGHGLYVNPLFTPAGAGVLEQIAKLIQPNTFFYASLETELSRAGEISQVVMGYLSIMTTGRSGLHKTDYGTVEFTHTKRDPNTLLNQLYFDMETGIFRAKLELAELDLRKVGRNVGMLD